MKVGNLNPPLRIAGVCYDSLVDGEGVRTSIFFSGCRHQCPGCHNPIAQDYQYGTIVTEEMVEKIAKEINKRPYLSGITLTGGDPLFNPTETKDFLYRLSKKLVRKVNVWLYTGDTWENVSHYEVFKMVDVVVDGPFVQEKADKRLAFRGSSNQRIIDVKQSLAQNKTVLIQEYMEGGDLPA